MKKVLVLLLVLAFCSTGLFAAVKKPAVIREKVAVSSAKIIEDAINKACSGKEWAVTNISDSVIFATVETPECIMTVKLIYTKQGYTIEYRESNLDFDDEHDNATINATYNVKIAQELNNDILKNIKK